MAINEKKIVWNALLLYNINNFINKKFNIMKKVFLALMAVATIAMIGCKKEDPVTPSGGGGDTPTPTPTPTVEKPDVDGTAGAITVVAYIPDGVCKDVYMEGAYQGWNIDPAAATKFEEIADYPNWFKATIVVPGSEEDVTAYVGHCKILLSDEEGNIPGDWSSQWNSDKVTIDEASAALASKVDDSGFQAIEFTPDAVGAVVYLTIEGWQNKPCIDYGVATAAKIKAANITAVIEEVTQNWQWADMTPLGNGVFTYEVVIDTENGDNFGCNTGIVVEGEIVEAWHPYEGTPFANGDRVRYTFTSTNGPAGTVVIEKVTE